MGWEDRSLGSDVPSVLADFSGTGFFASSAVTDAVVPAKSHSPSGRTSKYADPATPEWQPRKPPK